MNELKFSYNDHKLITSVLNVISLSSVEPFREILTEISVILFHYFTTIPESSSSVIYKECFELVAVSYFLMLLCSLLGYSVMMSGSWLPAFVKNILPSSLGQKQYIPASNW